MRPPSNAQRDPADTAVAAVRAALAPALQVWLAAQPALRAGCDPETLHDARVALRRGRTILRQMRAVLPRALDRDLAGELRWIRTASGAERDLDVLIAGLGELCAEARAARRAAADSIETVAREEHERARRCFLRALASPRCRALTRTWRNALRTGRRSARKRARRLLEDVLARRLAKRYGRILALRKLHRGAAPEKFHELRIECKKLRDLVDAFGSALPRPLAAGLTRQLKRLQTALGEAQDAHVMARLLRDLARRAAQRPPAGMLAALARREREARREALKLLRSFGRGPLHARMERWTEHPRKGPRAAASSAPARRGVVVRPAASAAPRSPADAVPGAARAASPPATARPLVPAR